MWVREKERTYLQRGFTYTAVLTHYSWEVCEDRSGDLLISIEVQKG